MSYRRVCGVLAAALVIVSTYCVYLINRGQGDQAEPSGVMPAPELVEQDPALLMQLPEYRLVSQWQQILDTGLYPKEYDVSRHVSVSHIVDDIEASTVLLESVVRVVGNEPSGYTRSFFVRVLHALSLQAKLPVIDRLIVSARAEDQDTALSLAFEISEHAATAEFVQNVLASGPPIPLVIRLAEYVASHRDFYRSGLANTSLLNAYQRQDDTFARVSLLKVVDPTSLPNDALFDDVIRLLSLPEDAVVRRGFDMLLDWQFHFSAVFSSQQQEQLRGLASHISQSDTLSYDTRMRTLQYLMNYQSML